MNIAWLFLFLSHALFALELKLNRVCLLPLSRSSSLFWVDPYMPPALPPSVTQASRVVSAVSMTTSAVSALDPTQLSQNSRTFTTLDLLACNEKADFDKSKSPSPTIVGISPRL